MMEKSAWYSELRNYYSNEELERAILELRDQESFIGALVGAVLASMLGLVIWKIAACFGGLVFELSSLLIGMSIGYGIRLLGRGESRSFLYLGILAYILTLVICFFLVGADCGIGLTSIDYHFFTGISEVGVLSPIGGVILVGLLCRRRLDGDLVVNHLKALSRSH